MNDWHKLCSNCIHFDFSFLFLEDIFSVKNSIINLVTRLSSSYKWTKMLYNSFTQGIIRLLKYWLLRFHVVYGLKRFSNGGAKTNLASSTHLSILISF